ncbi:hypothetical protein [Noviherbaspirillum sp.]|uniref:hypothetical protein n=1 Tax=Noviherbaspirillum sp. TaxID=1926288 RepID=UPI002B462CFF|nr:hypothetical protein [Noviherbaspirillum sp.]HJV80883.1 hypothetical protein [Noviherbaspirillum sp.]
MFSEARLFTGPGRFQRFLLLVAALVFCLAILNRHQLSNGFSILAGDRYDAVIMATILEHWLHVFSGDAIWSQVSYFYPYTRTIANTDAYFLVGAAYVPFRLLGLDPFLSSEAAGAIIKSTGFIGTYFLCRKFFSFSFFWALLAAMLFTLSNGMTIHGQRLQLATVAFAPIMAMLLWSALEAFLEDDLPKFRRAGMGAGVFFGAWCMTCFYMAWFFTFLFSAFALVMLVKGGRVGLASLGHRLLASWSSVILVLAVAGLSLLPFVYAFLPKSQEVGVRLYETVFANTIPVENILQVGTDNLLFGRFYNAILSAVSPDYSPRGEYYNTGFSLVLFALFVFGCVRCLTQARRQKADIVLHSLVIATLVTWSLALNIDGFSAWYLVYRYFPGAKALNVIAAYQILLALPVVVVAVKYLSTQHNGRPLLLLLSALLIAGEINEPYLNLDRQAELARIALPNAPPESCRAFYVSGWEEQGRDEFPEVVKSTYAHNVTAMLVAQFARIPTINGIASFNPPDWNFGYPARKDYDERVRAYAERHHVAGLCKLDLNSKQWSAAK